MTTISVTWANSALEAIRDLGHNPSPLERARIGPPMVARSLSSTQQSTMPGLSTTHKRFLRNFDCQASPRQPM